MHTHVGNEALEQSRIKQWSPQFPNRNLVFKYTTYSMICVEYVMYIITSLFTIINKVSSSIVQAFWHNCRCKARFDHFGVGSCCLCHRRQLPYMAYQKQHMVDWLPLYQLDPHETSTEWHAIRQDRHQPFQLKPTLSSELWGLTIACDGSTYPPGRR